jgi:hypothetical protein
MQKQFGARLDAEHHVGLLHARPQPDAAR